MPDWKTTDQLAGLINDGAIGRKLSRCEDFSFGAVVFPAVTFGPPFSSPPEAICCLIRLARL